MRWPFRRKQDDMSVDVLLARAEAATPRRDPAATTAAPTGPDPSFRLAVQDVFTITGRGVVVTGRVGSGAVAVGHRVLLVRDGQVLRTVTVTGIEAFRAMLESAAAGADVGLLLGGVGRDDVRQGDVLTGTS